MRSTWVGLALLVGFGVSGGACRKKSEPAPSPAPAPAMIADAHDQTGKDAGAVRDAGPTTPPPKIDPIASLFQVTYTPGETLPDKLRRRIRNQLKDKSPAPIALHHIIDIPKPDGGREVFALYEYSAYEDCMHGYADRKEGRDHCLGELVSVYDGPGDQTEEQQRRNGKRYRYKQIRLNRACVALGAVRAVFGPPGPGETVDTGGSLAITSFAFTDALCEVRSYNHVLVADVDGDKKLEMYVDITTAKEELGDVRGPQADSVPAKKYNSRRYLYVLSGDDVSNAELALDLGSHTAVIDLAPEELVELRDLDHDGHLDVIQTKLCFMFPMGAIDGAPCDDSEPREKIAHVYDAEKDAYKEGVAMEAPGQAGAEAAPSPAPGKAPAPETAPSEGAASPAPSGGAPVKAPSGGASGGAPVPVPAGEAPARP